MKKEWKQIFVAFAAALALAGCGSSTDQGMYKSAEAVAETASMDTADADTGELSGESLEAVQNTSQKLVKTVELSMETRDFDGLSAAITEKTAALGGYVEVSELQGNSVRSERTRYGYFTLRIPADRLDEFLEAAQELGNVLSKRENVEDVTLQYVDMESHIDALTLEQERLLVLLAEADTMEDIIALEERLSVIRYELQSYESQRRTLENQITYATVHIQLDEVERITNVEEKSFFGEVKEGLSANLYRLGQGLRSFAIWLLISLPYLVLWALVLGGLWLLIRTLVFRRKGKRYRKQEEQTEQKKEQSEK